MLMDNTLFKKLSSSFGAEVHNLNLNDLTKKDIIGQKKLLSALVKYKVLVFRKQNLTHRDHVSVGEFLGQLPPPHLMYPKVNGYKDIIIIRDDRDNPPENEVWHLDLTFYKEPSFAAILKGIEIPKRGGDTLFADMSKIAQDLSDEFKSFLRNLSAIHSLKHGFKFVSDLNQIERVKVLKESDPDVNSAKYPVLKIHPISGEENLFVNSAYTKHL